MTPLMTALLAIVIAIVCVFLAARFGKYFFEALAGIILLFIIFSIIFVALIFSDATTLDEGMRDKENLFFLEHDGEFVSVLILQPVYKETGADIYEDQFRNSSRAGSKERVETFRYVSDAVFNRLTKEFNESVEKLNDDYFRIFIFNSNMFNESLNENVSFAGTNFKVSELLEMYNEELPIRYLAEIIVRNEGIELIDAETQVIEAMKLRDSDTLRPIIFNLLYNHEFNSARDASPIIINFGRGNIAVYPEGLLFKALAGMPEGLTKRLADAG